jgi:hypothetical protein
MTMQMTGREVDGVFVVTLEGRIVLGEESHSLRENSEAAAVNSFQGLLATSN